LILAAIDIGSNAARLLITEVTIQDGKTVFQKQNLIRIPLRLGFDVFETGEISKQRIQMFVQSMQAFKLLMQVYDVVHYAAYATSAMRDAKNAQDIIRKIKLETDIKVEVISGDLEAQIVYENHTEREMDKNANYLYIDVGGGSTELSFFENQILTYKKSFNIGTIRLLKDLVTLNEWDALKQAIKGLSKTNKKTIAIGSGGNINKVFSLSKKKDGKPLDIDLLKDYYKNLALLTLPQRIEKFNLRQDRADVIVPALQIYTNVMKWAEADEIYVPKIGLADGIIKYLYQNLKEK
jgi:exopolyphosphatase / guanosine-5'-triphosphate,3'-diphosphate pyrophosphatase